MPTANIADLNVLMALYQRPKPLSSIVFSSKAIAPDFWQPTTEVICLAVERCLKAGFIRREDGSPDREPIETFNISRAGRDQLTVFVKADPDSIQYSNKLLVEYFQISILRRMGMTSCENVLPEVGFGRRLQRIIRDLAPAGTICHRRSVSLALGDGD